MPRKRRNGFKKRFKRKLFRRRVGRIARATILRAAETKWTFNTINLNDTLDQLELWANISGMLIPGIPQGTLSSNRIGDKVMHVRTKFNLQISTTLSVANNVGLQWANPARIRVLIVKPRRGVSYTEMNTYIGGLAPTGLNDIFLELDPQIVKIVKQRKYVIGTYFDGTTDNIGWINGNTLIKFNFTSKKKMQLQYDQSTGTAFGQQFPYNYPYYAIVLTHSTNDKYSVTMYKQCTVNYKDF